MRQKQKNRALKRRRHINPEELHPSLRPGLTQGASAKEAQEYLGSIEPARDGTDVARYMREAGSAGDSRVPIPRFSGSDHATGFVRQSLDRRMGDALLTFPRDVIRAMQAGMICLRCLEPQPYAFADDHLEGCEGVLVHGPHYMKDRQIMDFAMEFEGDKHIGPSKPMSEYLEEQDLRVEKAKFRAKKLGLI